MLVLLLALSGVLPAMADDARLRYELNGRWRFVIDPAGEGEIHGWHKPDLPEGRWDHVEVPHCWPVEMRYQHTGQAWYRRRFTAPPAAGRNHVRLRFGAVFYRSKVWLNGRLLGEHEGGYTPFSFDVSSVLRPGEENVLAVMADNSWSTETIPGARPGPQPQQQVYPWWAYGGIVRDVYLQYSAPIFVEKHKVEAVPDLENGDARVTVKLWLKNTTREAATATVRLRIFRQGEREPVASSRVEAGLPANGGGTVRAELPLAAEDVALWDYDHPNLYESVA
ncbi:MAG: beta-galactosidase, partial [bacterium]|nr:beta-galactosidase [bacterium]